MATYPHEEAPLTEHEKSAYRYLLYQTMPDIRVLCQPCLSWNPKVWRRQYRNSRIAGKVASWQHNLAHHSAYNFSSFSTQEYRRRYESLCSRFVELRPGYWMDYRRRYEDQLAGLEKEQESV